MAKNVNFSIYFKIDIFKTFCKANLFFEFVTVFKYSKAFYQMS